jgi:hypothetical protein
MAEKSINSSSAVASPTAFWPWEKDCQSRRELGLSAKQKQ